MPLLNKVGGGAIGAQVEYSFGTRADVSKVPNATPLSLARSQIGTGKVGDYALFAGGTPQTVDNVKRTQIVDAYNSSLIRFTPSQFPSLYEGNICSATIGDYAIMGIHTGAIVAYNSSLSRISVPDSTPSHYIEGATSVGDFALFWAYNGIVVVYDKYLSRRTDTTASVNRRSASAGSVGDYALFAGGSSSNANKIVDAFNRSLARSNPSDLSVGRSQSASLSFGAHALFCGGLSSTAVDAYDKSLTRSSPADLDSRINCPTSDVSGDYGLVACANLNITIYCTNLIKRKSMQLDTPLRAYIGCAAVGEYVLFGGGQYADSAAPSGTTACNSVESFKTSASGRFINVEVPAGCKYSFDGEAEKTVTDKPVIINRKVAYGYIKYKNSTIT